MKINAVSANYLSYSKKSKLKNDGNQTQPINQPTVELKNQPIEQPVSPPIMGLRNQPTEQPPTLTTISFKAGNKEQAILFVAETKPYFQVGGVATAMNDMRALRVSENSPEMTEAHKKSFDFWVPKDKVIVDSFYNGQKIYNETTGTLVEVQVGQIPKDLNEGSKFKPFAGKYFLTNNPRFQEYLNPKEFLEKEDYIIKANNQPNLAINKHIFILEDVTGPNQKYMDFGGVSDTEIKLFRVCQLDNGKLKETNDFKIFTDVAASWKRPYEGGGYASNKGELSQTWKGDGDARSAKAFVEFLEKICELSSKDGVKFDPATIMLQDSQAAYAAEYMAQKAADGGEFWQGKKPTLVTHNTGEGYVQRTSFQNMFVNIADKELRSAVHQDPEYIKALKEGADAVEGYFAKLLPDEIKDAQGKVSPFMNTIYLAKQGYVPAISTVSEGYFDKVVSDPDFIPAFYTHLKALGDEGKFTGILNAFADVNMNPYTKGIGGYYNDYTFPDNDELGDLKGRKIEAFKVYDKNLVNETSFDPNHVREIKRKNKISLFERLNRDYLEAFERIKSLSGHETDMAMQIAGASDKKVKVFGHIDTKYLEMARNGEDVKLVTSWGRVDAQKGLDSVLNAFANYVKGPGINDKNTVLVMGGEIKNDIEGKNVRELIKRYINDADLKGRLVYLDGFAPNKPLASAADFAMFPSRFAPCELTDFEAMKVFCVPIVTDCQGLAQKNFDASVGAAKATSYKTAHEFNMSVKDMLNALPEKQKAKLNKDIEAFYNKISNQYRISHGGSTLEKDKISELINKNADLNYAFKSEVLRPYRDFIIESDLTECLKRALIDDRNAEIQDAMIKNHMHIKSDWEINGELSKTKKSSAQLYRERHFQKDAKTISKEETILGKIRERCKDVLARAKKQNEKISQATNDATKSINENSSGNTKKYIAFGALALAAVGGVYYYFKNKKQKVQSDIETPKSNDSNLEQNKETPKLEQVA